MVKSKSIKTTKTKTKGKVPDPQNDLFTRIQRIIAGQLKKKPDQITINAGLQTDLQGDSLDALEIIFQLEEEFHIKIDDEDARKMATVQDIVRYVTEKTR